MNTRVIIGNSLELIPVSHFKRAENGKKSRVRNATIDVLHQC